MVACAVKICRNYAGKKLKPPEGISFHSFPTELDQRQEWIRAVSREPEWVPGTHCSVCSDHFEDTDFKEPGRTLHKHAVPTRNLHLEETIMISKRPDPRPIAGISTELLACRVCLATDTILHNLHNLYLTQTFSKITGHLVSESDGLPQHICNLCYTLLHKCAEFRARCDTSQALLEDAWAKDEMLTTDIIRTIDRPCGLALPLSIIKLQSIDLTERDIDVKQEDISVKQENIELIIEEDSNNDTHDNDGYDIFEDKDDKSLAKLKSETSKTNEVDEDVKKEIFIEVDTRKILQSKNKKEPKRSKPKKEPKKKTPKVKKDKVKKDKDGMKRITRAKKNDEFHESFSKQFSVDIVFLSKEEQIAEVQARKDTDYYKISRFKCDVCFKGFASESAFKNHQTLHDPSMGSYVCEPCGFRFQKRFKLFRHLSYHKMNFVCTICKHVTKLPSKAREHFKWHNGVKYPCPLCDKSFINRTSQSSHMRNRHGSACCDICQEVFSGERGLSAHMIKGHKEAVKYRCETCGVQFHNESAFNKHFESSPDGLCRSGIKACPECGDSFPSEEELLNHTKESHWKPINCDKCTATFENEKLYRIHYLIHKDTCERAPRNPPKEADCEDSKPRPKGKPRPQTKDKVKAKPRAKSGVKLKQRMCEVCGLTWRSEAALRYHQRVHTGEKPYHCPICDKSFRIQDALQVHMNTHTGARPFKCAHCPKAFRSHTQKHKHQQLVHSKIRRFTCDLCDKTFQTASCVKTHIKTVHMKIPMPPRIRNRPRQADAVERSPYEMYIHNMQMDSVHTD